LELFCGISYCKFYYSSSREILYDLRKILYDSWVILYDYRVIIYDSWVILYDSRVSLHGP
jgi:hypothetical protein